MTRWLTLMWTFVCDLFLLINQISLNDFHPYTPAYRHWDIQSRSNSLLTIQNDKLLTFFPVLFQTHCFKPGISINICIHLLFLTQQQFSALWSYWMVQLEISIDHQTASKQRSSTIATGPSHWPKIYL